MRPRSTGGFNVELVELVELVDMAQVDLPFMDEPDHPGLRRYEHEHTRLWSAPVSPADAARSPSSWTNRGA